VGDGSATDLSVPAGGITTTQIQDLTIATADIANNAVTTIKIADNTVTPDKIEQGASGEVLTTDAGGNVVWAAATGGTTQNLATDNLNQNPEDRTYNLGSNDLTFIGTGNFGIGNGANPPQNKLHVAGATRTEGILNSPGNAGEPAYRFTADLNTGIFNPAADEIGFSVGNVEAIRIAEAAGNTNVTIYGSLELDQRLIDGAGATGAAGDVLRSTGTGVEWYTPTDQSFKSSSPAANSWNIRRLTDPKVALTANDHTVVLEATVSQLSLPGALASTGQILVIKDLGGATTTLNIPYIDYNGNPVFTTLNGGVIWLQSDGTEWQLIK
jgi:hypothetical protein